MDTTNINKIDFKTKILYFLILFLMISIIMDPVRSINSAKNGLSIWFNILLPSLLPFLVLSELLILSGFVKTFGKFLEPIMGTLFNIPGESSFPIIMSIISGYPIGSKLTCSLRNKNIITKNEGDRLITFSSTSSPLFILGTVLVGMLNSPHLKFLIIIPHYLGALTLGLLSNLYSNRRKSYMNNRINIHKSNSIDQGHNIYLGRIISESVKDGMNSMFLIGGLVIIYSVIIDVFLDSHIIQLFIIKLSNLLKLNPKILEGIFAGIFEISIGVQKVAGLNLNIFSKICIINFIIAWGGFSIQSQVLSFIGQTDINSKLFVISKFFHGVFSTLYAYILYLLIYKSTTIPLINFSNIIQKEYNLSNWISNILISFKLSIFACLYFVILSLLVGLIFINKKEA